MMEDKILGNMSFRYGWIKEESITLWGREYNVRIRTSSKIGEMPTVVQQNNYIEFKNKINEIASDNEKAVIDFILSNSTSISSQCGISSIDVPLSMIALKEVLFFQNGKYALLFDTIWSEAGMAILCHADRFEIGESCIVEFEV